VENLHIQSYNPGIWIQDNTQCQFVSAAAVKLNILKQSVSADCTFIREGETSRQEVMKRLAWMDMGIEENRLFWGRWSASSSHLTSPSGLVTLLPSALGGRQDLKRKIHNLLVEFDDNAVVVRVRKKEDKDIVRELIAWTQRSGDGSARLSSRTRNSFTAWTEKGAIIGGNGIRRLDRNSGSMELNPDSIHFYDRRSIRTGFKVPRDEIVSIEVRSNNNVKPTYMLKLRNQTVWGKKIYVSINPSDLIPVLKYLTQRNP
jgi:hypothetical protein